MSHGGISQALHQYADFRRRHWRLRLIAVISVLLILAGLMFKGAEAGGLDAGPDGATASNASGLQPLGTRLQPACDAPKTQRTSIAQLNSIVRNLDLPYLQAADVGTSGMLSDSRIIWAFGDTIRRPGVVPNFVANSVAMTSDTCVSQLLVRRKEATQPGPVIADRKDGAVYWPTSLTVLPAGDGDDVAIFTSRIRRTGFGAFDFIYLGADVYEFHVKRGGTPELKGHLQLTPDRADDINWGGASVVSSGYLYVFGTKDALAGSRPMFVARAPLSALRDRAKWGFWNGSSWTPDYRAAANVLSTGDGVSQTFSADVIDGKMIVVSKCGGDFGDTVCSWTAPGPTGPWQRSKQVKVPFRDGDHFQYAPMAHPELPLADGKLAVSYSRNTDNLAALTANPKQGRPVFVGINWP